MRFVVVWVVFLEVSMRKESHCPTSCVSTLLCVSYSVSSYLSLTGRCCFLHRGEDRTEGTNTRINTAATKNTEGVLLHHPQRETSILSRQWCDHSWKSRNRITRPVQ